MPRPATGKGAGAADALRIGPRIPCDQNHAVTIAVGGLWPGVSGVVGEVFDHRADLCGGGVGGVVHHLGDDQVSGARGHDRAGAGDGVLLADSQADEALALSERDARLAHFDIAVVTNKCVRKCGPVV